MFSSGSRSYYNVPDLVASTSVFSNPPPLVPSNLHHLQSHHQTPVSCSHSSQPHTQHPTYNFGLPQFSPNSSSHQKEAETGKNGTGSKVESGTRKDAIKRAGEAYRSPNRSDPLVESGNAHLKSIGDNEKAEEFHDSTRNDLLDQIDDENDDDGEEGDSKSFQANDEGEKEGAEVRRIEKYFDLEKLKPDPQYSDQHTKPRYGLSSSDFFT